MGNAISRHETTVAVSWHLASPTLWFLIEGIAAYHFTPWYSYASNYVSDLGVPYRHYNATQGPALCHSPQARLMNLNFTLLALGFGLSPYLLYRRARRLHNDVPPPRLKTTLLRYRLACSVVYLLGSPLIGLVHGGPREKLSGAEVWHGLGAVMAIAPANLHTVLTGVTTLLDKPASRATKRIAELEIVMGIVGLLCGAMIGTTPARHVGTVERAAIYSVYLWMYIKGVELALERGRVLKDKSA